MVQLKDIGFGRDQCSQGRFNSKMVQLKVLEVERDHHHETSFNSKMVQLKGTLFYLTKC